MPSERDERIKREPNFLGTKENLLRFSGPQKAKLFAETSLTKEERIKKEAKEILDKFAKALSKVENIPESFVEREEDRRKEKEGKAPDLEFRKIFFENAPATKKECIEAERGKWK